MRLRLISPARTPVAFSKAQVLEGSPENESLQAALVDIPAAIGPELSMSNRFMPSSLAPRYLTLDDDGFSIASTPIVSFKVAVTETELSIAPPDWNIRSLRLVFFSHHLCISDIDIEAPNNSLAEMSAEALEALLGQINQRAVCAYWEPISKLLSDKVAAINTAGKGDSASIFGMRGGRKPSSLEIMNHQSLQPENRRLRTLWTNRTYLIGESEKASPEVMAAARYETVVENGAAVADGAYVFEGNNILTDPAIFDDFAVGLHAVQNLYATLDTIFNKFDRLSDACQTNQSTAGLTSLIENAEALEAIFSFYEIEVKRAGLNLQGARRLTFVAAMEFYGIENVLETIRIKSKLLSGQIEREIQKRQVLSNRLVEASLVVISLFNVISTFAATYTLASDEGYQIADDTGGILDIVGLLGFNSIINVSLLITVIIVIIVARTRRSL